MGSLSGTCEIMESHEECDFVRRSKGINPQMDGKAGKLPMLKAGRSYALEDDINQLFEAINFRPSGKGFSQSLQLGRGTSSKKASKNPHRVGLPQASGIGISESVSLKQALRRLTISHASEMAAMKRLSNPTSSPGVSEAGAIKKLYRAVVAEANESGHPLDEGKGSLIEISIVPEEATMSSSKKMPESLQFFRTKSPLPSARSSPRPATNPKGSGTKKPAHREIFFESSKVGGKVSPKIGKKPLQAARSKSPTTSAHFSPRLALVATTKGTDRKGSPREEILPELNEVGGEKLTPKLGEKGKLKASPSLCNSNTIKEVLEEDEKDPTPKLGNRTSALELGSRSKPCTATSSCSSTGSKLSKSPSKRIRGGKLVFKPKTVIKKKAKPEPVSGSSSFGIGNEAKNEGLVPSSKSIKNKVMKDSVNEAKNDDSAPTTSKLGFQTHNLNKKNARKESSSPASSSTSQSFEVCSSSVWQGVSKPELSSNIQKGRICGPKVSKISRSKEKGQFSQSSKSSIGEYSTSTSISDESNLSGSSSNGNRPHMSKDLRWEAIHQVEARYGSLGLRHFKLLKRLGCGDIGTVYLAELSGTNCSFALKVMDNEFLACRKKMPRAQTEREILQMLDHPFLPTLYAYFTTDKFSCLVMEFCPGGDLHVLRQRQPTRCFSEHAARFYVAEVLLALEYLHMLGVIYRDLKPENILVREDGHIMLSDFDLSLRCSVSPMLLQSSSLPTEPTKNASGPCMESSCVDPTCLHPSCVQVSCFTPRLTASGKIRKSKSDLAGQVNPLPQLVAEPTSARSNSFVGTHEYLAPEIIKGEGHGSAVDWWTFGIFLYELIYGRTPFKGSGNEDTLCNVVAESLRFPESPIVSFQARDLIRGLLAKDPENRLGFVRGATEIKQHPFFEGLNWALIRCAIPPELPKFVDPILAAAAASAAAAMSSENDERECIEFKNTGEHFEFEMF